MSWSSFLIYAMGAALCWIMGAFLAFREKRNWALGISVLGSVVFLSFIIGMWFELERPPMRTMGETRLWYSFFLSAIGWVVYARYNYKWILSFSTLMSVVFVCINLLISVFFFCHINPP